MKLSKEDDNMIPEKLQTEGICFVLLEKGGKKPIQKDWTNKKIYYNNQELINHINNGGNYGVLGGGEKNLIIIDFDNEKLQQEIEGLLPKTFTVKTGRGLLHKYFISDKAESFKIFNENNDTLADIQGEGKQVVGADSIHPNGNKYEVIDDSPIAFLPFSEIKALLLPYDKKTNKKIEFDKPVEYSKDNFLDLLKSRIGLKDVLSDLGVDISKNPTNCLFHSSKGGKCLGWNNETAHCFHCEGSWNIFSLVKQYKGIEFKEAVEFLANKYGMLKEYDESRRKYIESLNKEKQIECFISKYSTKTELANQILNICPLYYDRSGIWWQWNDILKKWELSDEVDILNLVSGNSSANTINSKEKTEIINALKQESRKRKPKSPEKTWIQFNDIIFDLSTGNTFPATSNYFITNPIPWNLGKSPETPNIDRIFRDWVGKDYVPTLYEILAYCLVMDYPIHRLFCFIGSGSNGKSCFLNLLKNFIGNYNCSSVELDTLLNSRFEVSKLHKKLVAIMGETNFKEISQTSIIKKLTGSDLIGFEYKNKNPFDDYNYAKILISTNSLPESTDKSDGFYRRWCIIDFPNKFNESKDILSEIPLIEYENLAFKSVQILMGLLVNRKFTNEGGLEERAKRYEEKSNPFDKFIKECCDLDDPNGFIYKFEFEKKFNQWCKDNHFREFSDMFIANKMKNLGITQSKKQTTWLIDGQNKWIRVWEGIKWQ